MSERPTVSVAVPASSSRARYALGALLDLIGADARDARPAERPDLVYGDGEGRCRVPAGPRDDWDDPRPLITRDGGIAIVHLSGGPARLRKNERDLGFDAFYATYACLTAPWERADPSDSAGCPIAAEGFLARNRVLHEPLVHHYAELLATVLGVRVRRAPSIVLTHDVDNNFAHVFARRESWELLRRDLRRSTGAAARRAARLAARVATLARTDPNDRFDDWAAWHRAWGSRPAYFVASWGLFRRGADRRDVPYDVRHPLVRATLREAVAEGAEIGVHFSLSARESVHQLRREREALEEAVGTPVRSARHHWWALGSPPERTLRLHAEAGIELDCSLGFNDRAGFRRGIAAPFRPFDPLTERAADITVLPTIAMDAALFDGRPVDAALEELQGLHRVVGGVGGALVLDWHVHAANPRALNSAGEGLRRFLDDAVAQGAKLLTPLELCRA